MEFVKKKKKFRFDSRFLFNIANSIILGGVSLLFIFLFMHIIALSLSNNTAIASNVVGLFPKGFTFEAYKLLINNNMFWGAFIRSVLRVLYALVFVMTMVIITAYPLSKYTDKMASRNFYMWFLFIPALLSGGVIPLFILIKELEMLNTISALVIPTSVSIFNIILLLNFIRQLPKEMLESADLDGANEFMKLITMVVPCSMPSIATITLFTLVGHWNSWFDGALFSTNTKFYPLQSYLQTIVIQQNFAGITDPDRLKELSSRSMQTAQIVIAMLPVIIIYPFFQKFFMKGIVLGSVKG